mgnify:CR=1 FL=1
MRYALKNYPRIKCLNQPNMGISCLLSSPVRTEYYKAHALGYAAVMNTYGLQSSTSIAGYEAGKEKRKLEDLLKGIKLNIFEFDDIPF